MKRGRNDPCPCGSGKKYKKCHGASLRTQEESTPRQKKGGSSSITLNRNLLGLPGAQYQLWVRNLRKGEDPDTPFHNLEDKYQVVITLARGVVEKQNLAFEGGLQGDSYIQIAKPEGQRSENDADHIAVFSQRGIQGRTYQVEMQGKPNNDGRLAKLVLEIPAASFREADAVAFASASPFLSILAFELDVPVRIGQIDVKQMSTRNTSMTYVCPYPDTFLREPRQGCNIPYVQSLLALYREGISSNSLNYQFLCWYKIVEGINWKRHEELGSKPQGEKTTFSLKLPEELPRSCVEMRRTLADVFPSVSLANEGDDRWDGLVPEEVLGWRFNRIREKKLEPRRDKIAHMLAEPSGDLGLSPDLREHVHDIVHWISLLRFMARTMMLNEMHRIPQPQGTFTVPDELKSIDEIREHIFGTRTSEDR